MHIAGRVHHISQPVCIQHIKLAHMGQSLSRPPPAKLLSALCGAAGALGLGLALNGDCDIWTALARTPRNHYRGKVVWVTGASSGIGRAICEELARLGAELIVTSRRQQVLDEVAAELLALGARSVRVVAADLCDGDAACEDAANRALAMHGGRLDVLINNAGVSTRSSAASLDMDGVRRVMQLNYFAPVALTCKCMGALTEANGTVINISSIASVVSTPLRSTYCASKSALDAFFTSLRYEQPRVKIITICPGSTQTQISVNAVGPGGVKWNKLDSAIANGLSPHCVADRALAAASKGIVVSWIAGKRELWGTRLAHYCPDLWMRLAPLMFKGFAEALERSAVPSY